MLCVGPFTRLAEWISRGDKEYEAVIRLGARSDTDDSQGQISVVTDSLPSMSQIEQAMGAFRGQIDQVPPDHSAVKVDGVRSYRRARRSQKVELEPRRVSVNLFEALSWQDERLQVRVQCGKGTYIRSLARDLGAALGCGGYIEQLRRTRIGVMRDADAVTLASLREADPTDLRQACVAPRVALKGVIEPLDLGDDEMRAFVHGQSVELDAVGATEGELAVYGAGSGAGQTLLGIGRIEQGSLRPARVFAAAGDGA